MNSRVGMSDSVNSIRYCNNVTDYRISGIFLRGLILVNFANPSRKRKIKNCENFERIGCGSLKSHVILKIDMALFKYLQRSPLPNPNGPLSHHVPPSTIATANKEVKIC